MQVVVAVVGFALAAAGARRGVAAIYTALFLTASARAFQWPANSALLPQTVPPETLTNAVSWSGTGREFSTVGGPAIGGALLAAFGSESVYLMQAVCSRAGGGAASPRCACRRPRRRRPARRAAGGRRSRACASCGATS